jgi:glycosyltransferase involved in cell wall biosynthesis
VYNGARFLQQTLDSLLGQTYSDFELIVSDNASTDGTGKICETFAARDGRVRYQRSPVNRGAAWNHNRLVELATGEYFKWAMADDLCKPDLVGRCVEVLDRRSDVVLACTRTQFIDEDGKPIRTLVPGWDLQSDEPHERLRSVIYAGGHWVNADALAGVVRRAALERTRLLPRYQGGDKRPLAELCLMGKFVEIPDYLYLRRIHPSASSHNNPAFSGNRKASVDWMIAFFQGSASEVALPTWSLYRDYLHIVRGSTLATRHKLAVLIALLKAGRWSSRMLLREALGFGGQILTHPFARRARRGRDRDESDARPTG